MNAQAHEMSETPPALLIIDDEQAIRDMLTYALSNKNYRVCSAATSEEGIDIVRSQSIDLVIVDLKMPDVDGLDILRRIRQRSPDVAAIAITGYPELETTVASMRLGVFDYLAKPFDIEQILKSVERALEHQRRTRALERSEEINRLQTELLLHMSHEFKAAIETMEHQSGKLLQMVNAILELPKRSYGRIPGNRMEWQGVLDKLEQVNRAQERKATVFVVDDDPDIVQLLEHMLTREGYAVESAGDGRAALEKLSQKRPDFMILDLMMPKLNGFEVLDAITKNPSLKDLPVVVLTARYLTHDEKKILQSRVEKIVQKGRSDIHEILAILNERSCAFRSLITA